ncbi:glycosyltransferase [Prevotella melaninogenica]|uniref:glycosyltransferase n=1 Tax=Prevotella melaninogenica TaxID=28132 RepID=UPI001C5E3B5E|nr:glycosyltransferase family 2 protein [Prevotella melaninogenica]MBW4730054.1 glycosyltransferase [Prevotella melaninogenica]MBW4732743.1 glycosyltransferase [Prevotella melaninogenica]MBW4749827.1 glycosyltransferase [Prevotella melaninogenica]
MNDILLSVIVPVYNGGHYLPNLINSIIDKNNELINAMEIIIVNDGSTDDSWVYCEKLVERIKQIRIISKENGGIASARNFGLKYATGNFITFCDQDDIVLRAYLPFIKQMQENNCDTLISDVTVSQDGQLKKQNRIVLDEVCDSNAINSLVRFYIGGRNFPLKFSLQQQVNVPNSIWNCIFSSCVIKKYNIFFEAFVDYDNDWKFCVENVLYSKNVYLAKDSFYIWMINSSSESHTPKYISRLYERRQRSIEWQTKILRRIDVPDNEIKINVILQTKRSIIWGFYNSFKLSYQECRKETLEIIRNSNFKNIYSQCESPVDTLYIFLLRNHLFPIAYFINKFFLKRRYH